MKKPVRILSKIVRAFSELIAIINANGMTVFMKLLVQSKSSAYFASYCATLALDYRETTVFRVWDKILSFLNKLVVNGI